MFGRVLENHPDAIDLDVLDVLFDVTVRRNQAHCAGRHSLTEALTDVSVRARGEQETVLVEQTPVHGVAGVDVFGHREFHEVDGSDDRNLSRPHVRLVDDAAHAAPVIPMRMGIDNRRNRKAPADVLLKQIPGGANHFLGHQRIKDDPAGFSANERDVGEVKAADLIYARNDLKEPVIVVEYGLAVQ